MTDRLRIALAQLNPHPGAVAANAASIRAARAEAAAVGAALLVTPHFSLGGAPPGDLARVPAFIATCEATLAALAAETADGGPGLILGGPWAEGGRLFDAAFLLDGGRVLARRARHLPPPDGVFDSGPAPGPVVFRDLRLGLMLGGDWRDPAVPETLAESGAEILLAVDADPFTEGEPERRIDLAVARVVETGLPFAFTSQVGGQGERVFDGGGFVLNADRSLALRQPMFAEAITPTDWALGEDGWACAPQPLPPAMPAPEQLWRALVLALADHVRRGGFSGVLLELAGDVDSALLAACAVDALGAARVRGLLLPSPGTGPERLEDAAACATLLGIKVENLPTAPALAGFQAMLGEAGQVSEGRIRATALLARAEASGALPLAGGNRGSLALGHGEAWDGGYALLRDLWQTEVLGLARWRNAMQPVMPARLLERPSSPPDGLPPWQDLDLILRELTAEAPDAARLLARGFEPATVTQVWRLLDRAGYKRRQAPPGVTLGRHAFGRERRYPLFHGFTDLVP
ncbi:nitrilase-related carbon-nitrogen hydrolase [Pseudoroseomonas ludipueritiae]